MPLRNTYKGNSKQKVVTDNIYNMCNFLLSDQFGIFKDLYLHYHFYINPTKYLPGNLEPNMA